MEALIPLVALVSLGLLALRFGADSRPAIRSHEDRLARAGMVWDATSRPAEPAAAPPTAPGVAAGLPTVQLFWGPTLAAPSGAASTPFPTLQALDRARDPGQPQFATDPDAEVLEHRARRLIDQQWSEFVWLTGCVDRARFDLVCDALEHERQSQRRTGPRIDVIVVSEHPASIAS